MAGSKVAVPTVAQPVGEIPTYAQFNDFGLESAAAIDRISRDCDSHFGTSQKQKS
jgi:hypothetical protein